ncbi:hypothetical protein TNCV_3380761, partial [Trichonephila clavipes]
LGGPPYAFNDETDDENLQRRNHHRRFAHSILVFFPLWWLISGWPIVVEAPITSPLSIPLREAMSNGKERRRRASNWESDLGPQESRPRIS